MTVANKWGAVEVPSPSHPGVTLRETLSALHMSQADLARRAGMSTKHLNAILQGKSGLNYRVALRLEYALSIPAQFWCALETEYQLHVLRQVHQQPSAVSLHDVVDALHTAGLAHSARELRQMLPTKTGAPS